MIQLRKSVEKDIPFIIKVYRSTREKELSLTNWTEEQKTNFIYMQTMAQLAEYKTKYPGATQQIVLFKNKEAGRFYTWENENEIRIIDITLLPQFIGKGIGSTLLNNLIKRSKEIKKKITLHVDPLSAALKLYLRLGFVHLSNNGRHYYMEKSPE